MFDLYTCPKCNREQQPPQQYESKQSNLDLLMAEYKLGEEIGGKYFSYMYSCINYTFLFYGAAILVFYNIIASNTEGSDSIVYFALFYYLLPISTYIFGLFYAYNAVAISRQGYHMIQIENDIIRLSREMGFTYLLHGWDISSKKLPSGFILPYGTMLIFYLSIPVAFLIFGNIFVTYEFFSSPLQASTFITIIPRAFLAIYLVFMLYLIICMFKMKKRYNFELNKSPHLIDVGRESQ